MQQFPLTGNISEKNEVGEPEISLDQVEKNEDKRSLASLIVSNRDLIRTNLLIAEANKELTTTNKILTEKQNKINDTVLANYPAHPQISSVLGPYMDLLASALVNKYGLDRDSVLSIMGSIVGETQLRNT